MSLFHNRIGVLSYTWILVSIRKSSSNRYLVFSIVESIVGFITCKPFEKPGGLIHVRAHNQAFDVAVQPPGPRESRREKEFFATILT